MESMVIKTIWLAQFSTAGVLQPFGALVQQTISIIVGNQTVVKNLPIQFNQGLMDRRLIACMKMLGRKVHQHVATATSQTQMPVEIRLLTDIVIPPQVAFEVRIDSNAGVYGTGAVVCALSGYGKIFSAGNTF
jgi:hypothetical protein